MLLLKKTFLFVRLNDSIPVEVKAKNSKAKSYVSFEKVFKIDAVMVNQRSFMTNEPLFHRLMNL